MLQALRSSLTTKFDESIVDELLNAFTEATQRFYARDLRPQTVEGGRFSEAAYRLLEQYTQGTFTALGQSLKTDKVARDLENLPQGSYPDSVRLYIPRALRVIYDIRNNRNAAHLANGIDPNFQDATLIIAVLNWVLAEFFRLSHNVSASEAQKIIENLVSPLVPAIQEFDGVPKILKTNLNHWEYVLLLLYHFGSQGAQWHQLFEGLESEGEANLQSSLTELVSRRKFAHFDRKSGYYKITSLGNQHISDNRQRFLY